VLVPAVWSLPLAVLALAACVWQCSPGKQRCLNRSHRHPELAAFGLAADRDALRFGMAHGVWCVGSCWALMLLAVSIMTWHHLAMGAITLLMVSERLEAPRPPAWNASGRGKLLRILAAQTRIRAPRWLPAER